MWTNKKPMISTYSWTYTFLHSHFPLLITSIIISIQWIKLFNKVVMKRKLTAIKVQLQSVTFSVKTKRLLYIAYRIWMSVKGMIFSNPMRWYFDGILASSKIWNVPFLQVNYCLPKFFIASNLFVQQEK